MKSAVCATEVVVVRAPTRDVVLACGGEPLLPTGDLAWPPGGQPGSGWDRGTLVGKRYGDEVTGIEVLCTKGGTGSLSVDGRALTMKEAKKLPSSD